jgi:hypothetical protein
MTGTLKQHPSSEVVERMWNHIESESRPRSRGRARRGLFITAGVLVAVLGASGGAYAATGGFHGIGDSDFHGIGDSSLPEIAGMTAAEKEGLSRTQRLSPTFEQFGQLPGFVDGGYESNTSSTLRIVWDGPITSDARALVAAAARRGLIVTIEVRPPQAKHLGAALDKVDAALRKAGFNIQGIRAGLDGESIQLWGPTISSSVSEQAHARAIAAREIGSIELVFFPWTPEMDDSGTLYQTAESWQNNRAARTNGSVIGSRARNVSPRPR